MQVASLVAKCLLDGNFASYFAGIPSAEDDSEPIVLRQGRFERVSRIEGEERGRVAVSALVVREASADAEAAAGACERWVRGWEWERCGELFPWRIVGVDTSAPFFKERDGSGRHVWQFDVEVTVVRTT